MANINSINNDEPESAPQHNRWYNLSLGSSFRDNSSRFCTLRYEFKPASIDKTQPGLLHKNKENRVSLEFQNNQAGKPKVTFEGSSEDYKENDAVLFFDGESFHLEQLHRAVKRLRHVRLPGETTAPTITSAIPATESHPSPVVKPAKLHPSSREPEQPLFVEVERIEMGASEGFGGRPVKSTDVAASSIQQHTNAASQEDGDVEDDESMDVATVVDAVCSEKDKAAASKCDDSDEDIADIGGGEDDDGGINNGLSAAEALTRARVNVDAHNNLSSSSAQSDSDSSSSSSSSSSTESSDSESSHSINSI